jgi:hypothetical protein
MQMSAEGGEDACLPHSCVMGTKKPSVQLCVRAHAGAVLVYQKGAPPKLYISGFFVFRREIAAEEESAHSAPVPLSSLSLYRPWRICFLPSSSGRSFWCEIMPKFL